VGKHTKHDEVVYRLPTAQTLGEFRGNAVRVGHSLFVTFVLLEAEASLELFRVACPELGDVPFRDVAEGDAECFAGEGDVPEDVTDFFDGLFLIEWVAVEQVLFDLFGELARFAAEAECGHGQAGVGGGEAFGGCRSECCGLVVVEVHAGHVRRSGWLCLAVACLRHVGGVFGVRVTRTDRGVRIEIRERHFRRPASRLHQFFPRVPALEGWSRSSRAG